MPQAMERPPLVVGIDLGSAYCRVAGWRGEEQEPQLLDAGGSPSFPAAAALDPRLGNWLFGAAALAPGSDAVRYTDLKESILRPAPVSGEEVARRLLQKLKLAFQSDSANRIVDAVLAVPYSYTVVEREALRRAAASVPLPVRGVVNEPEAAVLAYRLDEKLNDETEHVLVFDAGASRCLASVLRVSRMGAYLDVELLGEAQAVTAEGRPLGGRELDRRLYQACLGGRLPILPPDGRSWSGEDVLDELEDFRLRQALQDARHQLSSTPAAEFALPWDDRQTVRLRREDIEPWVDCDDELWHCIQTALGRARTLRAPEGLSPEDIDRVLLVGTLNRAPQVSRVVDQFRYIEPREPGFEEVAVAVGASRAAAILAGRCDAVAFAPRQTPAFGLRVGGDRFDKLIPENAAPGFAAERLYTLPDAGARTVTIEACQGFSCSYTPGMSLASQQVELPAAGPRKLHVRMALADGEVTLEVTDRTEEPLPAARMRFAVR